MKNFKILTDFRLHMKLIAGFPILKTPEGMEYIDAKNVSPGVSNVERLASVFCSGQGIDVGASYFQENKSNGFPGAVPVDLAIPGSGSATALIQGDGTQDYVFASHILEHLEDPEKACEEAYRVLRPGGVFFTYCPFPGNPTWDPALSEVVRTEHKWQPTPLMVSRLLLLSRFEILYCEWEKDDLWSFVVVGRKS